MARQMTGRMSLSWDDADEAEAVAEVLMRAATDREGKVKDQGFFQDAECLMQQVAEARVEDAEDGAYG